MKKFFSSRLSLCCLLVTTYVFAFMMVCGLSYQFNYYASNLLKIYNNWFAISFIFGIISFVLLFYNIWQLQIKNKLFKKSFSKKSFVAVSIGTIILEMILIYLVKLIINLWLSIIFLPILSFVIFIFWLISFAALLQTNNYFKKFSWYKFYKQFRFNSKISIVISLILSINIFSLLYKIVTEDINKIILSIILLGLLTLLVEYLSSYSKVMTEKYNLAFKEKFKAEQLKTELIANVSHDIKTPLTSIINYADIIQAQSDVDSEIGKYTNIIHKKSIRLKSLIEDLIEASKIGTGNIKISPEIIDICELMGQIVGEYDEVANEKELVILSKMPQTNININVDSRYLWRVLENLFSNAIKYSLPQTRIYVDLQTHDNECCFSIKNISKEPLNILPDELTNQFVRGDKARSTAGNGLGLYIAKSLTEVMGGQFKINISGDLFEASICFKIVL